MAAFEDSFIDTGDTPLSAHPPDVGTAWTLITGEVEVFQIDLATGTRLQPINVVDNDGYHIDNLGSADHVTIFRVADTPQSSNHRSLFACVRLTDHNNFIGWRWFGTGVSGSRLTRCNAGSLTDLISVDGAESTIREGWVKIETEGDTVRLFHGGTGSSPTWTQVGSVTEAFGNSVTRQGLVKNGSTTVLNYIQYFEADVFGGGGETLTIQALTLAVGLDAPALTQAGTLAVQDADVAVTLDSPALVQAGSLSIADLLLAVAIEQPLLTQAHQLSVADLAMGITLDGVTLTTGLTLTVDGVDIALDLDNVALTQAGVLIIQGVDIPVSVDAVTPTQAHALTVADLLSVVGLDSPELTTAGNVLAVQDAQIAVTMDSPALTQSHVLAVNDAVVAVTLGGITIVIPAAAVVPYPHITLSRINRVTLDRINQITLSR